MSKIQKEAEAKLPTVFGEFRIIGFRDITTNKEHVALVMGDVASGQPPLVRIHSECLTGDTLFSLKCDCGFQLEEALKIISENKRGVLLYVRQEGRGIGLLNKIRAYSLQDGGMDTYDANVALGFKPDERNYDICAEMLKLLGVSEARLITNNPDKLTALRACGIHIAGREPIEVGRNKFNRGYLETKRRKFKHMLSQLSDARPEEDDIEPIHATD
ncbi:MAG: GTP cyclohydrolase II [Succinivibrionaceae bacterium]|nr:GTP cyclohydrolase II [Succinivibrionaceae bacterium]